MGEGVGVSGLGNLGFRVLWFEHSRLKKEVDMFLTDLETGQLRLHYRLDSKP